MATRTFTKMFSDISGKEIRDNGGTVEFSFGGKSYSVDLTDSERAEFEKAISKYIDAASGQGRPAAKKTTARKSARKKASPRKSAQRKPSGIDAKAVRAWAVENGIDVPQRGRIPGAVIVQFEAAKSGEQS